ncbi:MAG: TonB-dependent hemoglobin/transferrin/lactoferrin family receptor [Gammaproteobacteria bacterium]
MLIGLLFLTQSVTYVTAESTDVLEQEPISVESSKTLTPGSELVGPVTLIDFKRIAREQAQTVDDLVRYEPGIDVPDQGSRFGLGGFAIRGVGGNRVLIEQDGVPISNAFSIGSFSNAGRDTVDLAAIRQVEVIRGPASALFGSDAVGGVISFVTAGPRDYLSEDGTHFGASTSYHDVNQSKVLSATGAWTNGPWSALMHVTQRDGNERDNGAFDPLDSQSQNVLIKAGYGTSGDGGFDLTLEQLRADDDTQVISAQRLQDFTPQFGFPYLIDTTEVTGNDSRSRRRISAGMSFDDGVGALNFLRWRLYWQESGTDQDTFEARTTSINGISRSVERDRQFRYDQRQGGLEVNASSDAQLFGKAHRIDYGVELEHSQIEQLRSGTELDLATGLSASQVGSDAFPVRDFPISSNRRVGAYLQDQFKLGSVTIAPGLRYDRFTIDPETDDIFAADNPGIEPASLSDGQLSLKLGAVWALRSNLRLNASYVEGFRAPPVNDVNVGFTNLQFGYTAIPNPDLRPETSRGIELSATFRTEQLSTNLTLFQTRYDDFIEAFEVVSVDPNSGLLTFQSVNKTRVQVQGAELSARYTPDALPTGFALRAALAYTHGDDESADQPLASIAPLNGVVGLEFTAPDERYGFSVLTRAAARQNRLPDESLVAPAGYVVHDVLGFYSPRPNLTVRAGLYNLTDHNYTRYLDVQGLPASSSAAARFARPGRHFSLSLNWNL